MRGLPIMRIGRSRFTPKRMTQPPLRNRHNPCVITIVRGDKLYGITRRTGTSVRALMIENQMNHSTLQVGQTLRLPLNRRLYYRNHRLEIQQHSMRLILRIEGAIPSAITIRSEWLAPALYPSTCLLLNHCKQYAWLSRCCFNVFIRRHRNDTAIGFERPSGPAFGHWSHGGQGRGVLNYFLQCRTGVSLPPALEL